MKITQEIVESIGFIKGFSTSQSAACPLTLYHLPIKCGNKQMLKPLNKPVNVVIGELEDGWGLKSEDSMTFIRPLNTIHDLVSAISEKAFQCGDMSRRNKVKEALGL